MYVCPIGKPQYKQRIMDIGKQYLFIVLQYNIDSVLENITFIVLYYNKDLLWDSNIHNTLKILESNTV